MCIEATRDYEQASNQLCLASAFIYAPAHFSSHSRWELEPAVWINSDAWLALKVILFLHFIIQWRQRNPMTSQPNIC